MTLAHNSLLPFFKMPETGENDEDVRVRAMLEWSRSTCNQKPNWSRYYTRSFYNRWELSTHSVVLCGQSLIRVNNVHVHG